MSDDNQDPPMQFTKLFSSILDSTIWQEPAETKIVWITMLAMADRHGEVHASVPGLAKRAGVTLAECEAALECLKSPDHYSRTKDHEGRRIEGIDGGWTLLNHGKYRALLSAEERREYNRRKQAEYRAMKRAEGVNDVSMTVNDNEQSAHSTEAEAEAEAEGDRKLKLSCQDTPSPQAAQSMSPSAPTTREESAESPKEPKKPKTSEETLPEEVQLWNSFEALPKVRIFNEARRKKLATRRKDPAWGANWREAIAKLAASPFATGQNNSGWKADFDFLLQPDSLAKTIEGRYDKQRPSKTSTCL